MVIHKRRDLGNRDYVCQSSKKAPPTTTTIKTRTLFISMKISSLLMSRRQLLPVVICKSHRIFVPLCWIIQTTVIRNVLWRENSFFPRNCHCTPRKLDVSHFLIFQEGGFELKLYDEGKTCLTFSINFHIHSIVHFHLIYASHELTYVTFAVSSITKIIFANDLSHQHITSLHDNH